MIVSAMLIIDHDRRSYIHSVLCILNFALKKPLIPQTGTKGNASAVPPAIRQLARFSDADTSKTCNGITRPFLLRFSDGSSWGKARCCMEAAPTIPLSLRTCCQHKATQSSLFHINSDIST